MANTPEDLYWRCKPDFNRCPSRLPAIWHYFKRIRYKGCPACSYALGPGHFLQWTGMFQLLYSSLSGRDLIKLPLFRDLHVIFHWPIRTFDPPTYPRPIPGWRERAVKHGHSAGNPGRGQRVKRAGRRALSPSSRRPAVEGHSAPDAQHFRGSRSCEPSFIQ